MSGDRLRAALARPGPLVDRPLVVAFSGGLDSTVLLHALAAHGGALRAVHVHHGLQPAADRWAGHCLEFCARLGLDCQVRRVQIDPAEPAGPEAAARVARYAALREALAPGEVLVTAHQREDQVETLLLRLLRGSGPAGLAAMRPLSLFEPGWLWRPLLEVPRAELRAYAEERRLGWIEDPHNADPRYARSWLRTQILPRLRQRYAQTDDSLARAARLCAEAADLLDELAQGDLAGAAACEGLSVDACARLSAARRANLLRHWLRGRGFEVPSAQQLERAWQQVALAGADARPLLRWPDCELRRYRGQLFAMSPLPPAPDGIVLSWREGAVLQLPPGCGELRAPRSPARALKVRFMRGGERFRPAGSAHRRSLKNLFQERGVAPWVRTRTPLLEHEDRLVFVGGVGAGSAWPQDLGFGGSELCWRHALAGVAGVQHL